MFNFCKKKNKPTEIDDEHDNTREDLLENHERYVYFNRAWEIIDDKEGYDIINLKQTHRLVYIFDLVTMEIYKYQFGKKKWVDWEDLECFKEYRYEKIEDIPDEHLIHASRSMALGINSYEIRILVTTNMIRSFIVEMIKHWRDNKNNI